MNKSKICEFTELVNYISSFSSNIEVIKNDLIIYYQKLSEKKKVTISLQIIDVLKNESKVTPKYICKIIDMLKAETEQLDIFNNIYEDVFINFAENLDVNDNKRVDSLLCLLSFFKNKNDNNYKKYEFIYDKLISLEEAKHIKIYDIYLALLFQNNIQNIKDFLIYYVGHYSKYDFKYLYNKNSYNKHWLMKINNKFRKNKISSSELIETFNSKLIYLVILALLEEEANINYFYVIKKIYLYLSELEVKDIFVFNLCKEFYRQLNIACFCYENSTKSKNSMLKNKHDRNLLPILNKKCRLQNFDNKQIINLLQFNKSLQMQNNFYSNSWEEDLYAAYCVVTESVQAVLSHKKHKASMLHLNNIENLFQQLQSLDSCLEVLKYMFSLLFFQNGIISCEVLIDNQEKYKQISLQENFHCSTDFLLNYLLLLKKFINLIQNKMKHCKHDDRISIRIKELSRISENVDNAFWHKNALSLIIKNQNLSDQSVLDYSVNENQATTSTKILYQSKFVSSDDYLSTSIPECLTSILSQYSVEKAFSKMCELIKKYQLKTSCEAERKIFLEKYVMLKSQLKNVTCERNELYLNTGYACELVKEFLKNNKIPITVEELNLVTLHKEDFVLSLFDETQSENLILIDLMSTSCSDYNLTEDFILLFNEFSWNEQSPYKILMNRVLEFFNVWKKHNKKFNRDLNNISIMNIIVNEYFPNDIDNFKQFLFYNETLRKLIPDLKCFYEMKQDDIEKAIHLIDNNKCFNIILSTDYNYMSFVWDYLQKLKQLLQTNFNYNHKVSMFNYLHTLLANSNKDLEHDKIARIMNKNLFELIVFGLSKNIVQVSSVRDDINKYNNEKLSNVQLTVNITKKHKWLLKKLYEFNDNLNIQSNHIFNLEHSQTLYDGNIAKTALSQIVNANFINKYNEEKNPTDEELLTVLLSIPKNQIKQSIYIKNTKNLLLKKLLQKDWKYIIFMDDIEMQYSCFYENIFNWNEESLKSALQYCINHEDFNKLSLNKQEFLKDNLKKILVFEKVAVYLSDFTWKKFKSLSSQTAITILKTLLAEKQIELSLDWISLVGITNEQLYEIDECFLSEVLQVNQQNMLTVSKFLHDLNKNQALRICEKSLSKVNNINAFKVFSQFILHHESKIIDFNLIISINILMNLEASDCLSFFKFILQPILIIEQYLMNRKFDKLTKCFKIIRNKLLDEDIIDSNTINMVQLEKLLITYAKKALSFYVPKTSKRTAYNQDSEFNEYAEDETFSMPEVVPNKSEWDSNESTNNCMCCKKTVFSIFNRRHHCRRCGRVVCGLCSMNRLKLSAYNDLNVRVCNQCYNQTKSQEKCSNDSAPSDNASYASSKQDLNPSFSENDNDCNEWILTGNIDHDMIIREEFSYNHTPNISLCLSILKLYDSSEEAPNFLLSECETVIRIMKPKVTGLPNSEINYSLLIEILRSLAIAAKVKYSYLIQLKTNPDCEETNAIESLESQSITFFYAGIARCDYILNYADLASLLIENGCEGLLPPSMEAYDIQILREQLMLSEEWKIALEVSLKAGLDKTSVFAAWGKICLKAGAFRSAREKFSHCLKSVDNSALSLMHVDIFTVENFIEGKYLQNVFNHTKDQHKSSQASTSKFPRGIRPSKDPTLLIEIIDILEKFGEIKQSEDTDLQKTLESHIENNSSESSPHVINSFVNLKTMTNDLYEPQNKLHKMKQKIKKSRSLKSEQTSLMFHEEPGIGDLEKFIYDECLYYLNAYGSHEGIVKFYMKHSTVDQVLKYILNNPIEKNIFTEVVYMDSLKAGCIEELYSHMSSIDPTLFLWKDYLSNTCRFLEKLKYMNTLYSLQIFMKDLVRASMTCIYFYTSNCSTYTHLHENVEYLNTAEKLLRKELDSTVNTSSSTFQVLQEANATASGFIKKLSYRELDRHINTICKQREVAKFLADCEVTGRDTFLKLNETFATDSSSAKKTHLPTLFGSQLDRLQVATFIILCGQNVEDGFGLAFRIIQDYQLQSSQFYRECARYLARCGEGLAQVAQLCQCIHLSTLNKQKASSLVDELASAALYEASNLETSKSLDGADAVIRSVTDIGVMISCYINIRQLKSAYLLAVKHNRLVDVQRIQREAGKLGQTHVVALCTKRLNL